MTHNVKSELRRSMDAIHFSGDDKERMVALLMSAEAPRQRRSGKKLLLLALAATLVVGWRTHRRGGIHPLVEKRPDGL